MKNILSILSIVLLLSLVVPMNNTHAQEDPIWWHSFDGIFGGIINALSVDPQNEDILYAATFGGVFKSNNAGNTWQA